MVIEETQTQSNKTPRKKKNFFLKHLWDFILLGVLLIGTSAFYIARAISKGSATNEDISATILYEGKAIEILDSRGKNRNPLNLEEIENYEEIEINGKHTTLIIGVKHNAICVVKSGCPGQECVHEGWISEANHPIICAHNEIYIEVSTSDWGDISQG